MFNGKYSSQVVSMLDSKVRDLCWRPVWVNVLYPWIKHLIIIVPLSLSLSPARSIGKYWSIVREAWWNAGG